MAKKKPTPQKSKRKAPAKRAKKVGRVPVRKAALKKAPVSRKATPVRKPLKKKAAAKSVPCVDADTAQSVVDGCIRNQTGGSYPPDTKLGDLCPTATTLGKFCRCVSENSGVSDFPCGADNTLQDVVVGLTCP
jgi:hypothetical protein